MTNDETSVIAFEPRRPPEPMLQFAEVRLHDDAGNIEVLEFALRNKPEGFDLARLLSAWDKWRGTSAVAS
jgi:hypothetical protein